MASLLAVYSAVKAFNVNFAEGLWAELRPHGVDVCCTPLGMTYTEALERMGYAYDPETVMLVRRRRPRDHRKHRQRADIPCGRAKPDHGVNGVDCRPAHAGRAHERRFPGLRHQAWR